ncbi:MULTISPECIES: peptidase M22 [unclassified Fusibacter]|uniref:peptidase M22 n=1 Tax=unclassified Fusibacter TaxID=2624464 RepID=UPI0010132F45|nr:MULTISPECIES: peptidase M22 [unclassified Fusibacter]MCK8058887.1 peptidase M22 [Fusibacter sp. A2]NPE21962.1 peptidase M22 [Fusibacter sp. A1]RXV61530.1 peptidase M22 [Fusibacter sp. A1]
MILGIDTSNYTTSICLIDENGIVDETRQLIKVKEGQKGIRQSDAFYQHMQVLHEWVMNVLPVHSAKIKAIGVSTKPRPVEGSYMPVFNAGNIIASTIQGCLLCEKYDLSHQEGHLEAATSTSGLTEKEFNFIHLSGGTTEVHHVTYHENRPQLVLLSETADISIGQLVDRIGVRAGLAFPCGAEMDKRSINGPLLKEMPSFRMAKHFNLSGYENFYSELLNSHKGQEDYVYFNLFCGIESILRKMILHAVDQTGIHTILLAGGVAASSTLKMLLQSDKKLKGINLIFSDAKYASDNAFGTAKLAERLFLGHSL